MYVYSLPNPVAQIDTNGSTHICNGQSVTIHANGHFSSYLWNTGSTDSSITVSDPGNYFVIVTDSNHCRDTSNLVSVTSIHMPSIHAFPDTLIFYGDSVRLLTDIALTPPAIDSFHWGPDVRISCLTCPNPIVSPLDVQHYVIQAYSQGCSLSDSVVIRVILPNNFYIPNAFTPNGDGINDSVYIYTQSGVKVYSFTVYDRWGEKVHDGTYPWDGKYHGQPCEPGIYVYVYSLGLFGHHDAIQRKGSVTLIK
jgi:gliding motility-associated-like protein